MLAGARQDSLRLYSNEENLISRKVIFRLHRLQDADHTCWQHSHRSSRPEKFSQEMNGISKNPYEILTKTINLPANGGLNVAQRVTCIHPCSRLRTFQKFTGDIHLRPLL